MRVLYVNHTGQMSGAEHSLLSLLSGLPAEISPHVACPKGPFADAVRAADVPLHIVPGMEGSLRLQPIETTRALIAAGRAALTLRALARTLRIDVVHANSIRAGIAVNLAIRNGGPPRVVYVRDVLPPGLVSSLALGVIARRSAAVLPNSQYTAESFRQVGGSARTRVAYSPVSLERFDPARVDRSEARRKLGLDESVPVLAVIAQLTPWKGQDTAIRATAMLQDRYPDIRLLLVGSAKFVSESVRYDNEAYRVWLGKLTQALGVGRNVVFMGERSDIETALAAVDVLLVPSWEEPFGRAVVEGMAMERPVVATNVGGPPEIISDGETGVLLPPREPEAWAAAVGELLASPERRAEMGRLGRAKGASRFSVDAHVRAIVSTYEEALAASRG